MTVQSKAQLLGIIAKKFWSSLISFLDRWRINLDMMAKRYGIRGSDTFVLDLLAALGLVVPCAALTLFVVRFVVPLATILELFLDKAMSSAVVTSDDWEVCSIPQSIGSNFKLPAAALQTFISLSVVIFIPIYDRVFVPIARAITEKPAGITMLQRIGCGMFLSVIAMVVAAVSIRKKIK
ncbi:hypothetical protein IFM89_020640 [Coptis chinensis]|uniref:Uncharacterized protein n=1 Tax=Coptis chinensis TaxID=261450 RepID=A0A835M8P7_9MAGN|nr:hypothetical protein IFM89_020640 [Coptis chinensis]